MEKWENGKMGKRKNGKMEKWKNGNCCTFSTQKRTVAYPPPPPPHHIIPNGEPNITYM